MRELSLFLCLLSTIFANELHEHSLKHVQKRHDIPLEFIMNSHEHSDIRRSVRPEKETVERISSDKFVVRRDDPSSTEVVGDSEPVPDKFDQPSYDFMLPEGKAETSTILAVVDFITRKHAAEPKFVVNFDENRWFDIGEVGKTTADNADVYKATVILKAGVDVTIEKTDGGLYKFTVEAQQEDVVLATTMISVDVLSLAPTTKRTRVTVPSEPKTMVTEAVTEESLVLGGSSSTPESTTEAVFTSSVSSEVTEAPESSTSSDDIKKDLDSTTTAPEVSMSSDLTSKSPDALESTTSSSEAPEAFTSSDDATETSDSPEPLTTTPKDAPEHQKPSTLPPDLNSEALTTSTSSEDSSEEEVEVLDGSGEESTELEGSATPSSSPLPVTSSESTTSESEVSDASGDSSSELLTSSTSSDSSEESPIDGPVTILPLRASQDGKIEPLDVNLEINGLQKDQVLIPRDARSGDMIRNCHVALAGKKLDGSVDVELSIEPKGALLIRPEVVRGVEQASLFIGDLGAPGAQISLEVVAKYGDVIIRHPLKLRRDSEAEQEGSEGSEMLQLREMTIEIPDSLESGKTIGSVEEPMRILNSNVQFSLINGKDIILACQSENCLKTNPQKRFTLILMPQDGSLAPLQVNVRILEPPMLRTSDDIVRVSDNKIITKFAVITERTDKSIVLEGAGAKFLAAQKVPGQEGLYQLIVSNSAPSGQYSLEISLPDGPQVTVPVHVSNSLGHAHFRQPQYSATVDAKKMEVEKELAHVELEGVPIDEAKIMILDGNPGWVTVEAYGGRVKVAKFDGPVYTGKFPVRIGAVDKKTWTILTETLLELDVINGEEKVEKEESEVPRSRYLEATFDREKETKFEMKLEDNGLKLDPRSIFGIDEKGKRVQVEPMSVSVTQRLLKLTPESLKTLRTLSFTLRSQDQTMKYSVLIRLISSPEYLETQKKIAARPVYPEPWTREDTVINVEMNEELQEGQVLGVFPAVSGAPGGASEVVPVPSELSGDMKDAFTFDPMTGELKIRQRIDFESLSDAQKTFDLKLTSGEPGFESVATLRIKVIDVDDNSPVISTGELETISIPENLPAGSKIAELDVTDPDGSPSYTVSLEGPGSQNYVANITDSGTLSIFVANSSKIDREAESSQLLLVSVSDVSGNTDRALLPIRILDVNDNAPEFTKKMYEVEVVEDWPTGMVIDKLTSRDADEGTVVKYSTSSDMINVNSTSGVVTVAGDLWGKARDVPYKIDIVAEDSGAPALTSSTILSLRVRAKEDVMVESRIEFVEPKNGGGEVVVKENIPLDTKITTVKAETRGLPSKTHGILTYTLKDLINGDKDPDFAIDKSSGDIFAVKSIDYEKRNEYTLQITATSSEDNALTSSTLLKIHVENVDDNEPEFLESFSNVFQIDENVTKPTAIGRLTAFDKDSQPIFYHILPTCGSEMSANFTIDPEFGEIVFHPKRSTLGQTPIELCFLATSQREKDVSEVFFDGTARNMRKVTVAFGERSNDRKMNMHIAGNQSISSIGDVLDRIEIPVLGSEMSSLDYNLKNLQFVPANYELGRDVISPEGSVGLNSKTGELVATGRILDTPQGVYTAEIERGAGNVAVKQLHHIRNDRKLRYVLAMSRNEFGANSEKLRRQILEAIGDNEHGKQLDVYFDEPMMDRKNSTWTSVCFYLTRDNAILDEKQMSSLVSSSNGHIAKLHHIFKVVNIDACAPKPTSSGSSSSPSDIPLNTLILIGVVGLLIIALVALLTYVCCVSRYQRYLRQKTERMRMNSPGSYYKSPNLLPPPPGYIHTPPLPPPPPPAAIAFY